MFGFPESTEMKKIVPKDDLLGRVRMLPALTTSQKATFNEDITQVIITNVISPKEMPVAAGVRVKGFYVARVAMKRKMFNPKNVETLLRRIGQKNILLALSFGAECCFALSYGEHVVIQDAWKNATDVSFSIQGIDLDAVWDGIVQQVAGDPWEGSIGVDANLARRERIAALRKEIASIEKKARAEKQPARKLEIFYKMNLKRTELEDVIKIF